MTVEQQSGKAMVLLSLVVFVAVSLVMMIWDASANGAVVLTVHLPRLGLIAVLFLWLLRGNAMARWIVVAFLLAGGAVGISPVFSGGTAATGEILLAILYGILAAMLGTSSSVTAFLAWARRQAELSGAR